MIFIDTSGNDDPYDNGRKYWRQNQCNADVVCQILRCLDRKLPKKEDFAVIAAYRGQVDLLKRQIIDEDHEEKFTCLSFPEDRNAINSVVNTVDGFQGQEKAIVIYDVVRSARGEDSVGFLDEPRRLNVALSRARKLLIIVGDADFLSERARPSDDRNHAEKPILGEIVDEIWEQGLIFKSLEEALK